MATLYSDLYPVRTSPTVGVDQREEGYRITPRYQYTWIEYTFTGTEAQGDKIRLFKANAGTIIIPKYSDVYVITDPAVTLTLDVGDEDTGGSPASDVDRYADGINIAAVGLVSFGTGGVAYAAPRKLTEDCYITATFATLSTPAAGGKIVFAISNIGP